MVNSLSKVALGRQSGVKPISFNENPADFSFFCSDACPERPSAEHPVHKIIDNETSELNSDSIRISFKFYMNMIILSCDGMHAWVGPDGFDNTTRWRSDINSF